MAWQTSHKKKRSIPVTTAERELLGSKAERQTRDRTDAFWMVQPPNYGLMAQL